MALITLPPKFSFGRISKWGLMRAGNTVRSRFTGVSQRIVYPYAVWVFEGDLIDYPEPEASAIRAFLAALEGQKNTFRLPVPGYTQGVNYSGAINLTAGAAVRATSVTVGAGNNGKLLAGEYFNINGELKTATADIAGGVLNFQPALRAAAANGTALGLVNPYCEMAAIDDDIGIFGIAPPVKHQVSIKAIEAF
jgi:hypothetical protein